VWSSSYRFWGTSISLRNLVDCSFRACHVMVFMMWGFLGLRSSDSPWGLFSIVGR